jgi:hypothetical protein
MTNTRPTPEIRAAGASGAISSLGSAACLALLPKCPMCVAAFLAAAGLGAESASAIAPFVRPFAVATTAMALFVFIGLAWRALVLRRRGSVRVDRSFIGCCPRSSQ